LISLVSLVLPRTVIKATFMARASRPSRFLLTRLSGTTIFNFTATRLQDPLWGFSQSSNAAASAPVLCLWLLSCPLFYCTPFCSPVLLISSALSCCPPSSRTRTNPPALRKPPTKTFTQISPTDWGIRPRLNPLQIIPTAWEIPGKTPSQINPTIWAPRKTPP
jgi:hypothetical protein